MLGLYDAQAKTSGAKTPPYCGPAPNRGENSALDDHTFARTKRTVEDVLILCHKREPATVFANASYLPFSAPCETGKATSKPPPI